MKIYALTEFDVYFGAGPKTIQLFLNQLDALAMMSTMYNEGLKTFETTEDAPQNAFSLSEGYGDILNGKYRLSVIECELDLRSYIHDVQEMTVVAEERGVRTKLMEQSKSRPDVWELVQQWTEEFHEKSKDWDWGIDHYFYDEIDAFVDQKNKELDTPYPEIKRVTDPETETISFTFRGYPMEELSTEVTAHDGFATNGVIKFKYPKVSELTAEQIDEIDEYTGGRVKDSGCVTPWDVLLKFGTIEWYDKLMNTTNGHEDDQVHRINMAWVQNKDKFKPVLCALYERDIDEITDSDAFQNDEWKQWPENAHGLETGDWTAYNKLALETMKEKWDEYAENYLMHIADGKDLRCILDFVRG